MTKKKPGIIGNLKGIIVILLILIPILVLSFYSSFIKILPEQFSRASLPDTQVFKWNNKFDKRLSSESISFSNREFKRVEQDSVITHLKIKLKNVPANFNADVCLFKDRADVPEANYPHIIGGFSEFLCVYADHGTNQNPEWDIDLSATPISIPKQSRLNCDSVIYSTTIGNMPDMECEITLQKYQISQPRYQVFRIPYIDALVFQPATQESLQTSYYMSSEKFPLKFKKAMLFNSFVGVNLDRNNNSIVATQPCLKWIKQGGVVVDTKCFPLQTLSKGGNYQSPPALELNWNLQLGDLVTANCVSENYYDCAFYVLSEIPASIPQSAQDSFRDFGNVPSSALNSYCEKAYSMWDQTMFCGGGPACTNALRTQGCKKIFPQAELPINNAKFISQTVPTTVRAGQNFEVKFSFQNNGRSTWKSDSWYRVGNSFDLSDPTKLVWSVKRAEIAPAGAHVVPGGTTDFTFVIKAPTQTGTYPFSWQMVQDSVEWFGEKSPTINIRVLPSNTPQTPTPAVVPVITSPSPTIGDQMPHLTECELRPFAYSPWSECINGQRTRELLKRNTCPGSTLEPELVGPCEAVTF